MNRNINNMVTLDEIKLWESEIEKDNFSHWEPVGEIVYGEIKRTDLKKKTISLQISEGMENKLVQLSKIHKCSRSDLIRNYIADGIIREAV